MRYFEVKKARIEIIPMIDIMLFLLVFFAMLTLRMIPTTGHVTQLPGSQTAEHIERTKIRIEISDQGQSYIEGKPMDADQIATWIRQHDPVNANILIMGSDRVNLQQLMNTIDAVKRGGGARISLATRPL
jgi:biopolymer transport protein ExbD